MTAPERLPELLRRYLDCALPKRANVPAQLRITQRDEGSPAAPSATTRRGAGSPRVIWTAGSSPSEVITSTM
jgi:hypothetical protein